MYYTVNGTEVNVQEFPFSYGTFCSTKSLFSPLFLLNNAWFCLSPYKALFTKIF